jgi:hypothetical protein
VTLQIVDEHAGERHHQQPRARVPASLKAAAAKHNIRPITLCCFYAGKIQSIMDGKARTHPVSRPLCYTMWGLLFLLLLELNFLPEGMGIMHTLS